MSTNDKLTLRSNKPKRRKKVYLTRHNNEWEVFDTLDQMIARFCIVVGVTGTVYVEGRKQEVSYDMEDFTQAQAMKHFMINDFAKQVETFEAYKL